MRLVSVGHLMLFVVLVVIKGIMLARMLTTLIMSLLPALILDRTGRTGNVFQSLHLLQILFLAMLIIYN